MERHSDAGAWACHGTVIPAARFFFVPGAHPHPLRGSLHLFCHCHTVHGVIVATIRSPVETGGPLNGGHPMYAFRVSHM